MHLWVHMDVIRDIRFSVAFLETNERVFLCVSEHLLAWLLVGC